MKKKKDEIVFFNGRFLKHTQAHVSLDDHGFLYGDGVYETLRVYQGRVFLLDEHLKRLQHSADYLKLELPLSLKKIGWAILETAKRNHQPEAVVRLTVTRGPGLYGFDPALCKKNATLAIVSRPFEDYPSWYHERGIAVAVVSIRRNSVHALPPHVKSTSCVNGIYAKMESLRLQAQEGLMLSQDGLLTEATVSNIFLVENGVIKTPLLDGSLLAGTTRGYVIDLAKKLGLNVQEQKLSWRNLIHAEEIFLTNTTMEVLPVTKLINNSGKMESIGKMTLGPVGPVTRTLMQAFKISLTSYWNKR